MRIHPSVPLAIWLAFGAFAAPIAPIRATDAPVREMRIDPGTTPVPFGHARLTVEPLTHVAGKDGLSADYKVEITPFTSKNEEGRFTVAISDADLQRLANGAQIYFKGRAVNRDGTNTSTVEGRADPTSGDGGALRIQVEGGKGKLVFHTTYHLTR